MMEYLNGIGMKAERLSVAKKHYEDMSFVVQEGRLEGPDSEILRSELLQLRIMPNDKIDHPRKGGKDLADAVCGAIYNSIAHTPRPQEEEADIVTLDAFRKIHQDELRSEIAIPKPPINPPKRNAPPELRDWLAEINVI
jgi:hypothetical protein